MKRVKEYGVVCIGIILVNILVFLLNAAMGGGRVFGLFISGGGTLKDYGDLA